MYTNRHILQKHITSSKNIVTLFKHVYNNNTSINRLRNANAFDITNYTSAILLNMTFY